MLFSPPDAPLMPPSDDGAPPSLPPVPAPLAARGAKPIVHVRVRPTLARLGESPEQKRAWCLDHQNIVVRAAGRHPATPAALPPPPRRRRSSSVPTALPPVPSARGPPIGGRKAQPPRRAATPAEAPAIPRRHSSVPRQHVTRGRRAAVLPGGAMESLGTPRRDMREEHFSFDFVHGEDATQDEVFEESVLQFAEMALLAQCISIICYGPTGSGKTHSMMGSKVIPEAERVDPVRKARTPGSAVPSPRNNSCSVRRPPIRAPSGGQATDATASSPSSIPSLRETEWTTYFNNSTSNSTSNYEYTRTSTADVRESDDAMGLLPRLVRVLLDRRGEAVALDRVEPAGAAVAARGTPVGRGASFASNSPSFVGSSQAQKQQRLSLSLTLQELMFYGVELYMDEFRDLLDASKRPISSVGINGGLETFCQRLNGAGAAQQQQSTPRGCNGKSFKNLSVPASTTGAGTNSTSNRGGGMLISSVDDLHRCYRLASRNRVTKSHQRNDSSSRSHALFILQLRFDLADSRDVADGGAPPRSVYSYVAMVDLAGSERVKETKVEGEALREAQYINKSLSSLSAVLLALYQGSSHVPFRDSKLTHILRPCLEGGRVLALVHVPPCAADETISALQFAEQVRHKSVRSHNLDDANDMLVEIFEDLIDPKLHANLEAYRQAEIQHAQLCADIRLAYLVRESTGAPLSYYTKDDSFYHKKHEETHDAQIEKEVSASDVARARRRREFAFGLLTARHLAGLRAVEEALIRETVCTIEMEYEKRVESAKNLLDAKVRDLQSLVEKQRLQNAQIAEENNQPVLRDTYAMGIAQQLKDTSSAVTECVRTKLLLTECIRAVRQRLTLQGDLERCMDDQLKTYIAKAGTLGQTNNIQSFVSPVAEDAYEKEETRALSQQQQLLAYELSLLRQESTCFVRADEVWEGLWARAMRQQMLLAATQERILLERVTLSPTTVRWALRCCGVDADTASEVAASTTRHDSPKQAFSAVEEAVAGAVASSGAGSSTGSGSGESVPHIAPLPITLGEKAAVHWDPGLLGQRDDESKLQTAAIDMLLHDGIRVEAFAAPLEDSVTDDNGNHNHNKNNNNNNNRDSSSHPFGLFCAPLSPGAGGKVAASPSRWQSGLLRLCRPPRDASSYSLELVQSPATQSERRVFSIPLGESQLRLSLHVREAGAGPLLVLELRGLPPAATPGPVRLAQRTADAAATPGAAASAPADMALAQRLSCGGELVLPSTATRLHAEGSAIALRFPAPRHAGVEAVECVVAALAAVTVPIWGAGGNANEGTQSSGDGYTRVAYHHVPYVLLSGYGTHDAPCVPRVLGVSPLAYACTLQIIFYFSDAEQCGDEDSQDTYKSGDGCTNEKGKVDAAVEALHNLASIYLVPIKDNETDEDADGNTLLCGLQKIQALRLKTRALMRQQLFDAEDIKAELLYSYSENEFMHTSHIRNVQREAREFIELQRSQLNNPPVSVLRVTPTVCRELCGEVVPWTLWQWAYRWRTLQDADARRSRPVVREYNQDDVICDSFDGPGRVSASAVRGVQSDTAIVFEPLPGFLACMEI